MLYLAKGGKFIPTGRNTTIKSLLADFKDFSNRLHTRIHFQDKPMLENKSFKRSRIQSSWRPPQDSHATRFLSNFREALIHSDSIMHEKASNMDWLDAKAQRWLHHAGGSIAVVDCDKGLGDAIVDRDWLHAQIMKQLSNGFKNVSAEQHLHGIRGIKDAIQHYTDKAVREGSVKEKQAKFITSNFGHERPGVFRCRIKIHKNPIGVRPICNLTSSCIAPCAVFLVETLGPMLNEQATVIHSTDQFLTRVKGLRLEPSKHCRTMDVINLYPQVPRAHMMVEIALLIRQAHSWSLANFLIELIKLVMQGSYVQYQQQIYESEDGIPTGLSPAVILANLYMTCFDRYLLALFGDRIQFYCRLVDDAFMIDDVDNSTMLKAANAWHQNIQFEQTGQHDLSFLDLQISRDSDDTLKWELYAKPQNLYLYVPKQSNHPESVFKSLVQGGMKRIACRNKCKADTLKHQRFFKVKLNERGYQNEFIRQALVPGKNKPKRTQKLFLKVRYNGDIDCRKLKRAMRACKGLRDIALPNSSVSVAWSVGRNLFRMRYKATWSRQRAEGGA